MTTRFGKRRNSLALAVFAALVAMAASSGTFSQQLVVCPTCSQVTNQILQYARQLLQLEQEIRIAETEIENTVNLPNNLFESITGDINRLTNISSQASLLADNSGHFLEDLANTGGYSITSYDDFETRLIQEQNDISTKTTAFANMMALQPSQLSSYSDTLAALQAQAQSADGRQQTLQAIAGINAAVGQQIKTTHATISAGLQAQLSYTTAAADRRAIEDMNMYLMVDVDPLPVTGETFQVGD